MTNTLQQVSNELADLVAAAAPSVLRVDARRRLPATGLAWKDDLIITANHVVEADSGISVGLPDGESVEAKLIGRDPRRDLALLQVDAQLQPINRAEASPRVGSLVLALGKPRHQVNASLGLITGIADPRAAGRRRKRMKAMFKRGRHGGRRRGLQRMRINWDAEGIGRALGGFIRSDLTMYPGFSGGPLLGMDGTVYGMNTSGFAGGISVALPLSAIAKSADALLAHGKIQAGYLGVGIQTVELPAGIAEELGQASGLLVVSVEAESPAAEASLLVGDILTSLDNEPLDDVDELQVLLARLDVGSRVAIAYVRGGVMGVDELVIGER